MCDTLEFNTTNTVLELTFDPLGGRGEVALPLVLHGVVGDAGHWHNGERLGRLERSARVGQAPTNLSQSRFSVLSLSDESGGGTPAVQVVAHSQPLTVVDSVPSTPLAASAQRRMLRLNFQQYRAHLPLELEWVVTAKRPTATQTQSLHEQSDVGGGHLPTERELREWGLDWLKDLFSHRSTIMSSPPAVIPSSFRLALRLAVANELGSHRERFMAIRTSLVRQNPRSANSLALSLFLCKAHWLRSALETSHQINPLGTWRGPAVQHVGPVGWKLLAF